MYIVYVIYILDVRDIPSNEIKRKTFLYRVYRAERVYRLQLNARVKYILVECDENPEYTSKKYD